MMMMMRRCKEILGIMAILWVVVLFYLYTSADNSNKTGAEMLRVMNEVDILRKKNDQLQTLLNQQKEEKLNSHMKLQDIQKKLSQCKKTPLVDHKSAVAQICEPTEEQEILIKQINDDAMELSFFVTNKVSKLKTSNKVNSAAVVEELMMGFNTQQKSLLLDIEGLITSNSDWRDKEANKLMELVAKRIHHVQNPSNCADGKRLVCKLNKGCGFGCQLHHLLYCFLISYGTERTLIIDSEHWRYSQEGWESIFLPVSNTCTSTDGQHLQHWRGEVESRDILVVTLPIVDGLPNRPPYMPLAIPEDLSRQLLRLHGNPSVWWVGQFLRYLWRPQPWLDEELIRTQVQLHFQHPIVGIQVRRTDKVGTEAAYHGIDEYMKHVDSWYETYQLSNPTTSTIRRVYLATDDPSVLPEARTKYPNYLFISDSSISQSAQLSSRYTKGSLLGVIKDMHMLSKCDYLVCTFSSQVCRVAYELMQTLHSDASTYFHSLDDIYYFGGQVAHEQIARLNHKPTNNEEIELVVGDVIGIAGNHWDGYSKGTNRRSGKTGLYPSYKTVEIFPRVRYPTYPHAAAST